jgi:hypothetical protein
MPPRFHGKKFQKKIPKKLFKKESKKQLFNKNSKNLKYFMPKTLTHVIEGSPAKIWGV